MGGWDAWIGRQTVQNDRLTPAPSLSRDDRQR
jgi:hypothetical protein